MSGYQDEYDKSAEDEPDIVFGQNDIVGGKIGRGKRFFKGPGQEMKIDGDDQPPENDAPEHVR